MVNIAKRRGIKKLSDSVVVAIAPSCRTHNFNQLKVIADWPLIVGSELSSISVPIELYFQGNIKDRGRLVCGVMNPSYSLRLQMMQKVILDKVNLYFGYKAVINLSFRLIEMQSLDANKQIVYVEKNINDEDKLRINTGIAGIKDPDMMNSMFELGKIIFSTSNS